MQVFTSVIVLGLCFAAFVISHITDSKQRKADSMISLAQVIGSNSISAIRFQDNDAADHAGVVGDAILGAEQVMSPGTDRLEPDGGIALRQHVHVNAKLRTEKTVNHILGG